HPSARGRGRLPGDRVARRHGRRRARLRPRGGSMTSTHIPFPAAGALEAVPETSETMFNWEYALDREALVNLYETGKRLEWNAATDVDWSISVDPEEFPEFFPPEAFNAVLNPPRKLDLTELKRMRVHQLGWMLSQFLHGEQGALLATAQIVNTVPWTEAKFYAA